MIKRVLGAHWTLDEELLTSRELVSRLGADTAGRIGACVIVTSVVAYVAGPALALAWATLIFLNEFTELKLAAQFKKPEPTARRWLTPYFLHLALGVSLWTGMCLVLWTSGDTNSMLISVAVLLGILIHVTLFYNESRLQTLITGLPPVAGAAVMIGWSFLDPALETPQKIVASVSLFTLVGYLVMGAYKSVITRETLRSLVTRTARLAAEDHLTGLMNRRSFVDLLAERKGAGLQPALVFIDLDRFKPLNDQYGHAVGDQVLREIGRRLGQQPGLLAAARLGGDEFAALLSSSTDAKEADQQMQALHNRLTAPIRSDAGNVSVGASIGWVRTASERMSVSDALHSADVAMRRAKMERLGVVGFDPSVDASALASSAIEIAFRQAVGEGRIRAALQPIVSVRTGKVVSMELLARWPSSGFPRDPTPQEFIPIAEQLGLLDELLWSILEQTLPMVSGASWSLAINVSPSQLTSLHFLTKLSAIIASYGVAPQRIELEITEQIALRNIEHNCAVLNQARALGFRVVLDDFGAGYSSLAILDQLPLDKVKFDRAFVCELRDRLGSQKILKATLSLAHELGIACSVEGIESAEAAAMVTTFGCDQMQGYWIGMPELVEPQRVLFDVAV